MLLHKTQPEGQNFYTVARLLAPDGTALTTANVSGAYWSFYDLDAELPADPLVDNEELSSVGLALKSALTVDGYWPYDSTGYNVFNVITPADIELISTDFVQRGGHTYEVVLRFVTEDYGDMYLTSRFTVTAA